MDVLVPATHDVLQEYEGNLKIPEIRVWCHPHRVGNQGGDFYNVFKSFEDALSFISKHLELAENVPLIAFKGYELNLFKIEER